MPASDRRDYYEVLGVDRDASDADIKRAYRALGRKYHPDVNRDDPEAEATFKEISEAYAVLSNRERRAQYDRNGSGSGFDFGQGGSPFDIFDIFASAFGGSPFGFGNAGGRTINVGRDLRYDLEITLSDVLTGVEREITYSRYAACETCGGTGAEPGTEPANCPTCGGMGQVRSTRNTFIGAISTVTTCPHCRGEGQVIDNPCADCDGRGVVRREETVTVNVPAGVASGNELLLRGFGEAPAGGGRAGDLHVRIIVSDHDRFMRSSDDLHANLYLTMVQAAVGHTMTFAGLDGEVAVDVPAGTQPGAEFVIPEKGLPKLNRQRRGDLHLHAVVEVPRALSPREKELLLAFAEERGDDVKPSDPGLFERIRNAISGG